MGSLTQPLVSRPPYGQRSPVAVAELPEGGPTDKGLPVDPGIPGGATYSKPVDDIRKAPNQDEPIQRVEDADGLTKDRNRVDIKEDSKDQDTSYNGLGEPNPPNKTLYPYRDGVPNAHNAAFVAELWKLEGAFSKVVTASETVVVEDKTGASVDEILTGLDTKFRQRAKTCQATLKRADMRNLRWIFSVDCGHGPKAVKIRAIPKGQARIFSKLDLELSCSCPAWQWLGPEYHAKGETYMLGKPRGTASTPDIRDPERDNRVCKHVAAALSLTKSWEIPKNKMKPVVKKATQMRQALNKAMTKRACNVCVATNAINAYAGGGEGYGYVWETAEGPVTVYVRAQGAPEFGPAKYQIRREGKQWPSTWNSTNDLAGVLGRLGLDRNWLSLPDKVKERLQEMK